MITTSTHPELRGVRRDRASAGTPETRAQQLDLATRAFAIICAAFDRSSCDDMEKLAQALRSVLWAGVENGCLSVAGCADAFAAISLLERVAINAIECMPSASNHRAAAEAYGWIESRPQSPSLALVTSALGDSSGLGAYFREFFEATDASPYFAITMLGGGNIAWTPELEAIEAELLRLETGLTEAAE